MVLVLIATTPLVPRTLKQGAFFEVFVIIEKFKDWDQALKHTNEYIEHKRFLECRFSAGPFGPTVDHTPDRCPPGVQLDVPPVSQRKRHDGLHRVDKAVHEIRHQLSHC